MALACIYTIVCNQENWKNLNGANVANSKKKIKILWKYSQIFVEIGENEIPLYQNFKATEILKFQSKFRYFDGNFPPCM